MRTFDKFKESRLAKMRAGQSAGEICELRTGPDDDDPTRFVVVPLTDGEYLKALSFAETMQLGNSAAGISMQDEVLKKSVLFFSARELHDWTKPFFEQPEEVDDLYDYEVNACYDIYLEMVANSSPSIVMLTDEEIELLKKVWQTIKWNELSGQQLYAASRFLNSIRPGLLTASSYGSRSIQESTETKSGNGLAENVDQEPKTP